MYSVTLSGEFFNYNFEHITDIEIKNDNIKMLQDDNYYVPEYTNLDIKKVNRVLIEIE